MSSERTGAEILAEALISAGVDTMFGVPGDSGITFYDALYARRDRIRHVLARDERSAASMADSYARLCNRVGAVEASSGGGATFLVGGLGEAYAASVPILVITSDIHVRSRGTGAITEIDQMKLFSAVTKWQATVESAGDIPRLVREALEAATTGRPAPVSLVFPENVFDETANVAVQSASCTLGGQRPAADQAAAKRVAGDLAAAVHPVIVAGSGIHLSAAWQVLRAFAETYGVPVATTIHGKGSFPERHPLALGVVGGNGARDYANAYVASADWVLFVGTRANSTDTNGFASPPREGSRRIAQIDLDPARAGHNYPEATALIGDARTVLEQLLAVGGPAREDRRKKIARHVEAQRSTWEDDNLHAGVPYGIEPRAVIQTIQAKSPSGSVVVADAGTPTPYLAAFWQCPTAARSVVIPRGHGAMGFAVPAAVGAAVARSDARVLCFTTDGSFAMACGELETVSRLGLPITFIHFSNDSYGWIKMLQRLYEGERYYGVDFTHVDADVVAKGFGLAAYRVATLSELEEVISANADNRAPIFIDVVTPPETELHAPVAPWAATLAGEPGRPIY